MKSYLFVYGMFRDAAKPLLGDYVNCGLAWVAGTIYRVNDFYPGYKMDSDNKVWGEVFLVDDKIFSKLDEFEGEEFERKQIKTSNDIDCWIYVYKGDCSNFKKIKVGDWMLR